MTTERAPEPTMDEILASIKRIIADEDEGASGRGNGGVTGSMTHKHDGLKPFAASDEGDEQLIDDIARALNNAGNDGIAEDDDILDLTRVMTEQIEAEAAVEPKAADAAMDDPFELGSALRDPPDGAFSRQPQSEHNFADDDIFSLGSELPEMLDEAGKPGNGQQPLDSTPEISQFGTDSDHDSAWTLTSATPAEPSAAIFELPRNEPVFGEPLLPADTEPPFDLAEHSNAHDLNAKDLKAYDAEAEDAQTEDLKSEDVFGGAAASESVPGDLNPAPATDAIWEPVAEEAGVAVAPPGSALVRMPETAGPAVAETTSPSEHTAPGGKSMEDSVKEMLRPMLREWLNENMPRILESALRDELQKASLPDA